MSRDCDSGRAGFRVILYFKEITLEVPGQLYPRGIAPALETTMGVKDRGEEIGSMFCFGKSED